MILDTSFLVDVLRGADAVTDREHELTESAVPVVTSISVMELWEGVHLAEASASERQRVEDLLTELPQAAFDGESAMVAGELSARLTGDGKQIEAEDVMIAAIALVRDEAVLTGNPGHFERIEELAVESY